MNYLLICAPTDDLLADNLDAAEMAHRWNTLPILAEALKRITAADSLNRARSIASAALSPGTGD